MNVHVDWQNGMSFQGVSPTGFTVPLGTDAAFGGNNDGFKPMELMLISLAGCTGMDVISILMKKKQVVKMFRVNIEAQRGDEHPKVFKSIVIEYVFGGENLDAPAIERAVQLSEEKYCPAQAMLRHAVSISHKITIIDQT
ncbi:MAG: OsmC family protein [Anaerolineae bacterium]|nr:OsmC family protein [Anaerolineae bacterium]NPV57993.1 OsmC family protein [Anaerolineae bacterium]